MKQTGTIIRRVALCVLLVLLLMMGISGASADGKLDVWVSPTGILTVDAIKVMEIQGQAYLFLPGNTDLSQWKISHKAKKVTVNGEEILSGTAAGILNAENMVLTVLQNGLNKKLTLNVMYGSDLPSMYITTRSGKLSKIHKDKANKEKGQYWSSTLYYTSDIWDPASIVYQPQYAYGASIDRPSDTGQGPLFTGNLARNTGRSIRPVMD